jgi:glycogen operon protein
MLVAGDEIGRTQQGNNNGFAQDNEISWVNWPQADTELLEFTRHLIHLRQSNRVLQRRKFLTGRPVREGGQVDVAWFRSDGTEMDSGHWNDGGRSMGVWLNGDLDEVGPRGEQLQGSTLLLCFNLSDEELPWQLPGEHWGQHWLCRVDTEHAQARTTAHQANGSITLAARSVLVLEEYISEPAASAASSSPA